MGSTAGCSQILGIDNFELGADAAIDVPVDSGFCYGTSLVRACFTEMPSAPLMQAAAIDTDSGCQVVQPQANGPELAAPPGEPISSKNDTFAA